MIEDIAPGLLELLQEKFKNKTSVDKVIKQAMEALGTAGATYEDANNFAIRLGEILSKVYSENITAEVLPDGRMYFNIADRVITPTMTNNYDLIAEYTAEVQTQMNRQAGYHIKGQKPELNESRIKGIVNRLADEKDFNKIKWILEEPIINFSQSVVDDTVKANADFQYKSGLRPTITRKVEHDCCAWCGDMAGVYSYPDVPPDVYRRHRYCRCSVEYDPGDGRKQDIWSKKWTDPEKDSKIEARKKIGFKEKPTAKSNIVIDAIKSGEVKDAINLDKQQRHLEGQSGSRSYLYGDIDTAEHLFGKLKGTGYPIMDKSGKWTNKERVKNNTIIGVHVDEQGNSNESKNAVIIYSKTGSHIYPRGEKK